jgi:hypothetical protein
LGLSLAAQQWLRVGFFLLFAYAVYAYRAVLALLYDFLLFKWDVFAFCHGGGGGGSSGVLLRCLPGALKQPHNVVELFMRRVHSTPHAAMLIFEGDKYSYACLNRHANSVAQWAVQVRACCCLLLAATTYCYYLLLLLLLASTATAAMAAAAAAAACFLLQLLLLLASTATAAMIAATACCYLLLLLLLLLLASANIAAAAAAAA